jgi:4-hydroxybenzoate polyprenyltransferase
MTGEPAAPDAERPRWQRIAARLDAYERLIRLDKPIGTLLLLWPTLSALWLATYGSPSWVAVGIFVLGTLLMRSAGCAINDYADRHFDAYVERTANRPLARGEIAPWEALAVAAVLALCAFLLVLRFNRFAIALSLVALVITVVYPFFKRFFVLPQAFLGIAFSFGIPMAFAAVYERVPLTGWTFFAGNLFWVIAYDTEYAMVDREDDRKLGLRTSAIVFGRFDVLAVMLCYAVYLATLAWVGRFYALGWVFHAGVLVAACLALWHFWLIRNRGREGCFRAFLGNHWLGLAVFVGIAADFAIRYHSWPRWPG